VSAPSYRELLITTSSITVLDTTTKNRAAPFLLESFFDIDDDVVVDNVVVDIDRRTPTTSTTLTKLWGVVFSETSRKYDTPQRLNEKIATSSC
jgi:hypothetical protein